jgi:hypothetical protein
VRVGIKIPQTTINQLEMKNNNYQLTKETGAQRFGAIYRSPVSS